MPEFLRGLGLVVCMTAGVGPAAAIDIPVAATKLVVLDKAGASADKTVFVAKDPAIAKGPGADCALVSATLDLAYDGVAGQFVLPAGAYTGSTGWQRNDAVQAKFAHRAAPAAPTGVKVAVVTAGKVAKVTAKSAGDAPLDLGGGGADHPGAGRVHARQ